MAKNVTYFVAGSIDDIEYESTIALMINVQSAKSGHGELLLDSQTAVKDMQLSHGMDPAFYLASSRMFRVTVEEVPREEREDLPEVLAEIEVDKEAKQ